MKTTLKTFLVIATALVFTFAFSVNEAERTAEESAVKELVEKAYINGAFNKLDFESMEGGFHKDFAIFSAKGEEISKYPIADWVKRTKERRADNYNPNDEKNVWKHNFASVDVTGGSAQVKVELHNQGKHVFTDYLSLLKFDSGWKIVAKVYHRHE